MAVGISSFRSGSSLKSCLKSETTQQDRPRIVSWFVNGEMHVEADANERCVKDKRVIDDDWDDNMGEIRVIGNRFDGLEEFDKWRLVVFNVVHDHADLYKEVVDEKYEITLASAAIRSRGRRRRRRVVRELQRACLLEYAANAYLDELIVLIRAEFKRWKKVNNTQLNESRRHRSAFSKLICAF
jgi:hypothetical protein